jgi:hypothetical protein
MSKILRRPMFRGGPVDSRGTGITSGLGYEAGGRVGLKVSFPGTVGQAQEFLTGGDIVDLSKTKFSAGMPFPYQTTPLENIELTSDKPKEEKEENVNVLDDLTYFSGDSDFDKPSDDKGLSDKAKLNFGLIDREEYNKLQKEKADKTEISSQQVDTGDLTTEAENNAALVAANKTTNNNNEPSNVEISAQDLIRENAELFKELLGEGQKEKIKKARIGDASDYLLKFF